ncbi:MAG: GNAT family N-acetyltransferase [Nitrososphaerota archaeon]|jgi:L-amino acid N-acyltransferase YncA|nr:GNAT family N-acetyltransferase [Nitrososphaerota archaeon]
MGSIEVSKIDSVEQLRDLPKGLSFFDPLIGHEVKEALESGGETYLSKDPNGVTNGLFIYDNYEVTGTIFTSSREVFDYFYKLKPSSYIFSELDVPELPKQVWNIWQLDVDKAQADYSFKHRVVIESDVAEIERFMALAQLETNKRWISVALKNGDRCFVVKIAGRIVGMAWMTIVGDVARSHGLFVARRFRRMGMMMDNYHARLLYLKARHVHTLVNEIAEDNVASASLAAKEGEKVVGKIFLYTSPG